MPTADHGLSRLFAPATVAIIGASPREGSPGYRAVRNLQRSGFAGTVLPVTPRHRSVLGLDCVPGLSEVAEPPDLALVVTPAELTEATVRDAAAAGTPFAVVFASGFAEAGPIGSARQQAIDAVVADTGIRIMGPNCMGFVNLTGNVAATFSDVIPTQDLRPGTVAFVSQSGGMCAIAHDLGVAQGLRFSALVSSGNEADLSLADYVEHFAADPGTQVIGAYVEQVRDGRRLLRAVAAAKERDTEVVLMFGGTGPAGARAAVSHTGALAGGSRVAADLLAAAGAVIVSEPAEFVAVAQLLEAGINPTSDRVTIIANSGGTAVLAGDLAESSDLSVPELPDTAAAAIRDIVPSYATVTNPVDVTAEVFFDADRFAGIVRAAIDDPEAGTVVLVSAFSAPFAQRVAERMAPVLAGVRESCMVLWFAGSDQIAREFHTAGVAFFSDPRLGLSSLSALAARRSERVIPPPLEPHDASARDGRSMSEGSWKQLLAASGFDVPVARTVAAGDTTEQGRFDELAATMPFPVVAKALSPDVPHKQAAGLIRLAVTDAEALAKCAADFRERCLAIGARFDGLLVEETIAGGVELFMSMTQTAAFGPVLCVGTGGAVAERRAEVAFAALPLQTADLDRLLAAAVELPDDGPERSAGARVVTAFADWCWSRRESLIELELNPVRVIADRAVVLDATGGVTGDDIMGEGGSDG